MNAPSTKMRTATAFCRLLYVLIVLLLPAAHIGAAEPSSGLMPQVRRVRVKDTRVRPGQAPRATTGRAVQE